MDKQVQLPELAESIVEAEVIEWFVAEGDLVERDQPLLEVSSDKATVELPSPYAGRVTACLVKVGETIAVGAPVARIDDSQPQDADQAQADAPAAADESSATGSDPGSDSDERLPEKTAADDQFGATAQDSDDDGDRLSLFKPSAGAEADVSNPFLDSPARTSVDDEPEARGAPVRPRAVPAARIAARRLGVNIEDVTGSGPVGRIRVDDVKRHVERVAGTDASAADGAVLAPLAYHTPAGYAERERRLPLRGMRKTIAQQMTNSHLHAVRTLVVEEVDMTRLQTLRGALRARAEARGVRLSFLPFVFKALVSALKTYPEVNTSLDEVNNEIVYKDYYNIGLAVATDKGLMVPVVRDVDARSLSDVAAEINRLSEGARKGRLDPAELRGATCSVTNIGSIGGLMSFPIINSPDAAILGVHAIRERPVAIDGEVHIRPMMYLSLSFDHRLVDGAEATHFLMAVVGLLERPEELLLDAI
jgi:2-oxoisovalerate dehydrogenase E2 component (dihydrolipoyl transacylase)